MRTHLLNELCLVHFVMVWAGTGLADFAPVQLTGDSYNHDVVIERNASPPLVPATTASMDAGAANTGFSWFERGYFIDWPAIGLPEAGSILVSDSAPDHLYQFAPSYQTNNVILLDSSSTRGTAVLSQPSPYSRLSVLTSSGGGDSTVIGYTVHFQDGSMETGSFTSPDWVGGSSPAWSANGRIDVATFTRDLLNSDNPRLYCRDFTLTNRTSRALNLDFTYIKGFGHNAIFALSGAADQGSEFGPIAITGYNADMVVEASAIKPGWLDLYTTATMDNGTANARKTWYETGYYQLAPETGLPPAGASLVSQLAADHVYSMARSYTNNNAVLLDSTLTSQFVTLAKPARYAALSLLTASGHGPVTNICIINYADGRSQTNLFVSPDWFDNSPAAFTANGCVSISTKLVTSLRAGFPRLFSVDLPLNNTNIPVTSLSLSFKGGGNDSHAVVFAVSGAAEFAPPITIPRLSIRQNQDGTLAITASGPGTLQSSAALQGPNTVWHDEGPVSPGTSTMHVREGPARFFRVVAK